MVDGRKRVGQLRTAGAENEAKYRSIARVNHFFADLNDFLDAGLLNHLDAFYHEVSIDRERKLSP